MGKVRAITAENLDQIIEHKVLEILGDPDAGLRLKPAFRKKLQQRLKNSSRRTPHREVVKKFA